MKRLKRALRIIAQAALGVHSPLAAQANPNKRYMAAP